MSPRSSPPPEHSAQVSDLPRCIPARPQLVLPRLRQRSRCALHVSVGRWLPFGAPLCSGCDPGLSGHLRAALRTRLRGHFARFGRGSARCRVLDDMRPCRSRGDGSFTGTGCVPWSRPMMKWCARVVHAGWHHACTHWRPVAGVPRGRTEFIYRFCKDFWKIAQCETILRTKKAQQSAIPHIRHIHEARTNQTNNNR